MPAKPLRVLIATDKFKGTLTAEAAALAIQKGWQISRPRDRTEIFPITDGGDGFGVLVGRKLQAIEKRTRTIDAAHRPCSAKWWYRPAERLAIIESAAVIGLAKLPKGEFHPFELDTFGLGSVLRTAVRSGAKKCVVGIGGSATSDGGFGLARSLGRRFLDRKGNEIDNWPDLIRLSRIESTSGALPFQELLIAVDVKNPLLGPKGATRIYGPQKGLRETDFAKAEAALQRLAECARLQLRRDCSHLAGAGAAGGLGFGLAVFANARLCPGFELFSEMTGLESLISRFDVVITGEGKLDHSSFMGKGIGELARLAKKRRIRCFCIAGTVDRLGKKRSLFKKTFGLADLFSAATACDQPGKALRRAATLLAASC